MIILFIGSPGAGKGTQCKMLSEHLKLPHLSTGEILRKAKSDRTPLGIQIAETLDSGQLVDDSMISQIVDERSLQPDCENGFLLDGFPRTLPQAQYLDKCLASREKKIHVVIELFVPESVSITRLSGRYSKFKNPRPEDHPDAIPKRIAIYKASTQPLFDYYKQKKLHVRIDGTASPKRVFRTLLAAVKDSKFGQP